MKRKQKHYTTEQQIIDKIDEAREKSDSLNRQAELSEANAAEAIKQSQKLLDKWTGKPESESRIEALNESYRLKEQFNLLRDNAIKCRKQARRIEEVKLPLLGEALSEFRTAPIIPILGQDLSVASLV